ncbi:MAG TPA: hypothetical protein PK926_07090 [Spirochaetota bacterium]|nr:hypothetical protein [Spirochaetota bacterium]HPI90763.1 hypothetical protein [Spirochaetota bacterium]HPR48503.1 hypothetical protein [Spirochaetota bacterium]
MKKPPHVKIKRGRFNTVLPLFLIDVALFFLFGACEPRPDDSCYAPDSGIFVVTTDYSTGSYSVIDPDILETYNDIGKHKIHSDAMVRYFSSVPDYVYIINRLGQDNIQALNRNENYSTVYQVSTGNSSNPHDLWVVDPERAYVSRYGESSLLIMNPSSGKITGSVDLSGYGDSSVNGIPRMSRLYHHDGLKRLFVAVQRLASSWHPSEYSSVIVIDTDESSPTCNEVIREIKLTWDEGTETINATNPYTNFRYVPDSWWDPPTGDDHHDHLFISCVGEFGYFFQLDCGIVAIDVTEMSCEQGYVLSEETAGTEITEFVIKSGTEGYATTSDKNFHSKLIKFNPQDGSITSTVRVDDGEWGYLWTLGLDGSGMLYLCDRNALEPGVRIYDTNDEDRELNDGKPLYVGLPPFDLAFIE